MLFIFEIIFIYSVSLFKPTLEVFTKDRPSFIGCIDDAEQLNGGLPPQYNFFLNLKKKKKIVFFFFKKNFFF
jgi:hypothetical protein